MRILQVASTLSVAHGGPVTTVRALSSAWHRSGHSVKTIVTDLADPDLRRGGTTGTVHRYRAHARFGAVSFSPSMHTALGKHVKGSDVVIIHQIHTFPAVWAGASARQYHRPYAVLPHGSLMPDLRRNRAGRKWVFERLWSQTLLRQAAAIVVSSTQEAELSLLPADCPQPVAIVPGAEHAGPFIPVRSAASPIRILYLGRLAREKNIMALIDAWILLGRRRGNAQLWLVGPTYGAHGEKIKQRALAMVDEGVIVYGYANAVDRAELLASSTALVQPSTSESFGLTIVEALWQGCAVVATPNVPAADYAAHVPGVVIARNGTAEALADAIEFVLPRKPTRELTHAECVRTFSWDHTAAAVLETTVGQRHAH